MPKATSQVKYENLDEAFTKDALAERQRQSFRESRRSVRTSIPAVPGKEQTPSDLWRERALLLGNAAWLDACTNRFSGLSARWSCMTSGDIEGDGNFQLIIADHGELSGSKGLNTLKVTIVTHDSERHNKSKEKGKDKLGIDAVG